MTNRRKRRADDQAVAGGSAAALLAGTGSPAVLHVLRGAGAKTWVYPAGV
jgi:hypothetical protein